MAVSGHPISPTEGEHLDGRLQIASTWRGVILSGLGFSLIVVGMWRVDGVMAAMGFPVVVLFGMSFVFGWLNLRSLALDFEAPRRVEAGKSFSGKLTLTNGNVFFDSLFIEFGVDLMGEKAFSRKAFWIPGRSAVEVELCLLLRARGLRSTQRGWVKSSFPLGLMSFSKKLAVEAEIGVLTKPNPPHTLALRGFLLNGIPLGGSKNFCGHGEWKGLREQRGGDGLKRIAWAASLRSEAAGGGILVREDEPPGSQAEGYLVVFHSYGGDGDLIRPDRFEKALSLLCGALGNLVGLGMPVRWIADFNGWEMAGVKTRRHLASVRESLLTVTRASATEAHDLSAALARASDHECVVVVSDMPRSGWEGFMPDFTISPVLVDIREYDGSRRKNGTVRKGGSR